MVPVRPSPAGWAQHWPAAALAAVAALVALWARHRMFPALSWNRDEPVYLWHVEALRAGHLTPPDGGHPELFLPWLSAAGDGVVFTQYTLGWPLVLLAADVLAGGPGAALLVGAALAVLGTYALAWELLRDRAVATLAGAALVASPVLAVQGGAYLSYLFTLGLGLLATTGLLAGARAGRPALLVGAGVLIGWIFLTRPFDAVLWGGAAAVGVLARSGWGWRPVLRPVLVTVAAALPFIAATLAYNRHVTGSWLQFPITAADPLDTFGFGPRRLMPLLEAVDYTPARAARSTAKNLVLMPWFLTGAYLGVLVAATGLWARRRDPAMVTLLAIAVAFPLGYVPFWGTYLSSLASRISAPIYLVPLYAPACILMAVGMLHLWRHGRRTGAVVAAVALVAVTVPLAADRLALNRDLSALQEAWRDPSVVPDGPAVVMVADSAYVLFLNPFGANDPGLEAEVLFTAEDGPALLDLLAEQPHRTPYLQQASLPREEIRPREDPVPYSVALVPLEVVRGDTVTLSISPAAPAGARLVVAADDDRLAVEQDGGPSAVQVELATGAAGTGDRAGGEAAGRLVLAGRGTVTVTLEVPGAGGTPEPVVRQALAYRVAGDTIEALVPLAAQRAVPVGGTLQWQRVPTVDGLAVEVTLHGAAR